MRDLHLLVGQLKGQVEALGKIVEDLNKSQCPYVNDIEDLKKFQWKFAGAMAVLLLAVQVGLRAVHWG